MNTVNTLTFFIDNGALATQNFSNLSFSINNTIRAVDAVSNLNHIDIKAGRLSITGSMNIYFEDIIAYQQFIDGNAFFFSFAATDSLSNTYFISVPAVKFSSGSIVAGGLDTDLIFEAEFEAIVDPTTNSMIQIDRFPA